MVNLRKPNEEKYSLHFFIIDSDANFANKVSRSINYGSYNDLDIYHNKKDFIAHYNKQEIPDKKENIHVIIIDSGQLEQKEDFQFIRQIKKVNKNAEIIILASEENINSFSDTLTTGVYTIIHKNENVFYRIDNSAKGIKSLHIFQRKRRTMKRALWIFSLFLFIILILFFIIQSTV